ncbi:hypothetical protein EIP91_006885 [Steccherinum ochraceum]|uniref:HMG box domain-containing protein n=1 Tax=Steccherinum ochraceum TaxID=92696 RepID=A0A4R0RFM3_9APHY|nr:hypothetical protein EIP91_006885 [Steccherinum ochraceum]
MFALRRRLSARVPLRAVSLLRRWRHNNIIEKAFQLRTTPPVVQILKYPDSAYTRFLRELWADGTVKHVAEGPKLWRDLSDAERKPYFDAFKVDVIQYKKLLRDDPHKYRAEPARPLAPHLRFFREQHASGCFKSLSRSHAMWAMLSEDQKQPYTDAFNADMVTYRKRKLEWTRGLVEGSLDGIQWTGNVLDGSTPTRRQLGVRTSKFRQFLAGPIKSLPPRPRNSFHQFRKSSGLTITAAGSVWRQMTDEEKKPFEEAYARELEEKGYTTEVRRELTALTVIRRTLRRVGHPRRPAPAYLKFYQEWVKAPEVNCLPTGERATLAGQAWRRLTDQEKAPYLEAFAAAMAEYRARQQLKAK